jgi:hypothetical protein
MWLAEFGLSLDAADEWAKAPTLPWRRPSPATPDQEDGPQPGRLRRFMLFMMSAMAAACIRMNAVSSGAVKTPMYRPEMHGFLAPLSPTGRMGTSEEIVEAVLYLETAGFVTGEILHVDGGAHAGRW